MFHFETSGNRMRGRWLVGLASSVRLSVLAMVLFVLAGTLPLDAKADSHTFTGDREDRSSFRGNSCARNTIAVRYRYCRAHGVAVPHASLDECSVLAV